MNTDLLRDYVRQARDGNRSYYGEIAGKLRILVIEARSNKALLQRVGALLGGTAWVTISTAPGWTTMDGHKDGDRLTLDEWLDTFAVGTVTTSSPTRPQPMTRRDLILAWSQQTGASHEDWTIDERLRASRDFPLLIQGHHANERMLLEIADLVLDRATHLLAYMTPERIAAAQKTLDAM